MNVEKIYNRSLSRVNEVRASMKCGLTPECQGVIQPRHSVLSSADGEPYVEDIQVKCDTCLSTQKHGIGITESEYEQELEERDGERVINYVSAWPDQRDIDSHLAAMGYKEL